MPRGGVTFRSTFRFIFRSGFRFTFRLERNTQYRLNSPQMRTIRQTQQRPTKRQITKLTGRLPAGRQARAARSMRVQTPTASGSLRACDPSMHVISSTIHKHPSRRRP